ncbi:hypothetical protein ACFW1P_29090 [Paenibacillus sp. NPDC058910]|uniref:hypothetical protein n=1 Tax=unclassified Paenibacillus TaxID=185978 RepID=UPI0036B55823
MIQYYRNKTWLCAFLLAIFLAGLCMFMSADSAQAQGKSIPVEKLKKISRLSFNLRDTYQNSYTVYIYAQDEKSSTLTEMDYWTGNKPGDKEYTGTYKAALVKKGATYGTIQSVNLGLHSVTLPQTWHYTIRSQEKGTPDILMITEWGTSNFNLATPFIIRSGSLMPVKFVDHKGKKMDNYYPAGREDGVRMLSDARVQFKFYNNAVFKYAVNTFKLNVSKLELRLTETRYMDYDHPSWPNSGIGDRAYLESLKAAAKTGILPDQPGIKLGMTHKSLQSTLKKAKLRENGEWGAFYVYQNYAIGFDSYLHELDSSSRLMIFNLFAEKRNLYPSTVKLWLGKPNDEFFNEAEGVYDMIYNFGSGKLSFHYEEEDGQIFLATIYR